MHVFISYAWTKGEGQAEVLQGLVTRLKGSGHTVFWDGNKSDHQAGDLDARLSFEIQKADAAVILLSQAYYVREGYHWREFLEIERRLRETGFAVVPLIFEDVGSLFPEAQIGIEGCLIGNYVLDGVPVPLCTADHNQKASTYTQVAQMLANTQSRVATDRRSVPVGPFIPLNRQTCALRCHTTCMWKRPEDCNPGLSRRARTSSDAEQRSAQTIAMDVTGEVIASADSSTATLTLAWQDRYSGRLIQWPHPAQLGTFERLRLLALQRIGNAGARAILSCDGGTLQVSLSATNPPHETVFRVEQLTDVAAAHAAWLPDGVILIDPAGRPSRHTSLVALDTVRHLDVGSIMPSSRGTGPKREARTDERQPALVAAAGVRHGYPMLSIRGTDGKAHDVPLTAEEFEDIAYITVVRNGYLNDCVVLHSRTNAVTRHLSLE